MTTKTNTTDGILRRTVLKTGAAVGALGLLAPTAGATPSTGTQAVDTPDGFGVEVLSGHATFPDDVGAKFRMKYGNGGTIVSNLPRDASTTVVARVTWDPEGTSGWHTHPGPVIVSIIEGEVEITNARDCLPRIYTAGEAFVDPGQGNVHIAVNPSASDSAVAYATFLGVPDGEPATIWVPSVDC